MSDDENDSALEKQPLKLNPGAQPRPARSAWSCVRCTCLTFTVIIGTVVGWLVLKDAKAVATSLRHPYQKLYQNQTLDQVQNMSSVVRPLIGRGQTFDLAFSVWVRVPPAKKPIAEWDDDYLNATDLSTSTSRMKVIDFESYNRDRKAEYRPLYSDIALSNLTISNRQVWTNISMRIPTEIFNHSDGGYWGMDLSATFVLIPHSPSLLDHVTNYSHWVTPGWSSMMFETDSLPDKRTWPFPMGSLMTTERTLYDNATDLLSTHLNLIRFHEIPSSCPKNETATSSMRPALTTAAADQDPDENVEVDPFADRFFWVKRKRHPHITTRQAMVWMHISVVDDVPILNRKLYNKAHRNLQNNPCDSRRSRYSSWMGSSVTLSSDWCKRTYESSGPLETRFKLSVPSAQQDGQEPTSHEEWAYAPFLSPVKTSLGPKDLVPIPVNRPDFECENATTIKPFIRDAEFVDVVFKLSFSGRTPAKFRAMELGGAHTESVNHTHGAREQAMAQENVAVLNGLLGFRFHENAHPRRQFLLQLIISILYPLVPVLDVFYWYTLPSTVGVSRNAALMKIGSDFVMVLAWWLDRGDKKGDMVENAYLMFLTIFWMLSITITLAGVLRLQVKSRGLIPVLVRSTPTPKEQMSQRLERSIGSKILMLFAIIGLTIGLLPDISPAWFEYIIAPHPLPTPTTTPTIIQLLWYLWRTLFTAGSLLQIFFNAKNQTFAGSYQISANLQFVADILLPMFRWHVIVGTVEATYGLSLGHACDLMMSAVLAYQAVTLEAVKAERVE